MSAPLEDLVRQLLEQEGDRRKLAKAIARLIREEEVARRGVETRRRYQLPKS